MLAVILPNTVIKPGESFNDSFIKDVKYDFLTEKLIVEYVDETKEPTLYDKTQFKILFDLNDKIQQYDYVVALKDSKLILVTCNQPFDEKFVTVLGNFYTNPELRFLDKISDIFYLNKSNNKIYVDIINPIKYVLEVFDDKLKLHYYFEYFGKEESEPILEVYRVSKNDKYPVFKYRNDKIETNVVKYLDTVAYVDNYSQFLKDIDTLKPIMKKLVDSLYDNYFQEKEYYVKDNIPVKEFIDICRLNSDFIKLTDVKQRKISSKYDDIVKVIFDEVEEIAK